MTAAWAVALFAAFVVAVFWVIVILAMVASLIRSKAEHVRAQARLVRVYAEAIAANTVAEHSGPRRV